MSGPSRGFKVGSIVWALLIAVGLVFLAGSVLLPSTKRARVDWDALRREEEAAALVAPTTTPVAADDDAPADASTRPAAAAATRP
jgi:hypothetical protein